MRPSGGAPGATDPGATSCYGRGMWRPDRSNLIRIRLHRRGQDRETAWAEDCGPAPAPPDARFVRLASIPFIHAKPTYGDVVVVRPDPVSGALAWDGEGRSHEETVAALIEDGGRWTMILDYLFEDPRADSSAALAALARACEQADIAVEDCYGPWERQPGRTYLAVPGELEALEVLAYLQGQALPLSLTLVHPLPREDDDP